MQTFKKQILQNLLCPKPRLICFEKHLLALKVKQANVEKWWWIAAAGIIYEHKFFSPFRISPHLHMLEQLITPSSSCLMLPSGIVSDLLCNCLGTFKHDAHKAIIEIYKEILRLVIVLRKGISTYCPCLVLWGSWCEWSVFSKISFRWFVILQLPNLEIKIIILAT